MDTVKKVFDDYGKFMDQEIVAVQIGCYSVALIGLTSAIRKVRPFSRFKKPKDIPKAFIEQKRELSGYVKRIDPIGGILMVEHKPLISLPIIPRGELPIKILGVKVSNLGVSWLQTIVADKEIIFIPVKKETDFLQCNVLLPNTKSVVEKTSRKKSLILKKLLSEKEKPFLNVGECLVKVGFAEITPVDKFIIQEQKYYESLYSAELYALKKKLGMRYYLNPAKEILVASFNKIANRAIEFLNKIMSTAPTIPSKMTPT